MKLYGLSISVNVHARSMKDAEAFKEELLTILRNDNGEDRDTEVSVDSAEEIGNVEELE